MSRFRHHRLRTTHTPVTEQELRDRLARIDRLYWRGEITREAASRNSAKIRAQLASLSTAPEERDAGS